MAEKDLAIQYKRQYSEAIDADYNFTTVQRNNYLSDPLRYAGQIVFDSDEDKLYRLNGAKNAWIDVAISSGGGHTIKNAANTSFTQRANLKFIGATVTDNPGNSSTDITIAPNTVDSVNSKTGVVVLVTDDIAEDGSPINLWFTESRVRATLLTGLSLATSIAITASDSVLSAFGKLQAQITTLLGRIQNSMAVDGTGNKIPTVDAVNTQANNLARAVVNVGLVDVMSDAFQLARVDDTHMNVTGTSIGVVFPNYFHTPPYAPSTAIRQIPTNTNYPLSSLTGTLPAVGTQGVYFLGWRDATQVFETSSTTYVQNPDVFQCGVVFLKNVAGVISFIDSVRHVIPVPDVSQYSNLETTAIGVTSNIIIKPVSLMTVRNLAGSITGLSVNYKGTNNDEKPITATNPLTFLRLNPGNANAVVLPASSSTVVTTDYWNGSAMVALSANGKASVQRWLISIRGGFILQVGEVEYNTLDDAIAGIDTATFQDIIPKGTFVELCRMAATKDCTDLTLINKARFVVTGKGGGGGSGGTSVPFANITGAATDNTSLATELSNRALNLLTGYVKSTATTVSGVVVAATDTVLQGLQKLEKKAEDAAIDQLELNCNPDALTTSTYKSIVGFVSSVTENRLSTLDNTSISSGTFTYNYRLSTSATPTTGVSFATLATALTNTTDSTRIIYVSATNTTSTIPTTSILTIKRY